MEGTVAWPRSESAWGHSIMLSNVVSVIFFSVPSSTVLLYVILMFNFKRDTWKISELLRSCFPTLPCQVTVGKPSTKYRAIVFWCWLTEHLPQSWEDQGGSQRSESRTGGECKVASGNSMPCSCPQATSKLEVARWTTVSLGSGKHTYFADVSRVQRGRGGTNRTREVSMGGGVTASSCCPVCVFGAQERLVTQWLGSSFVFLQCQLPVQAHRPLMG